MNEKEKYYNKFTKQLKTISNYDSNIKCYHYILKTANTNVH